MGGMDGVAPRQASTDCARNLSDSHSENLNERVCSGLRSRGTQVRTRRRSGVGMSRHGVAVSGAHDPMKRPRNAAAGTESTNQTSSATTSNDTRGPHFDDSTWDPPRRPGSAASWCISRSGDNETYKRREVSFASGTGVLASTRRALRVDLPGRVRAHRGSP